LVAYSLSQFEFKAVEVKGHKFIIREGTSDLKTIHEVIVRNAYQKRGFKIIAGERWLDFGACIGAFTVLAKSCGAEVIAFEPDPLSFALLQENVARNGYRCELRNEAVTATKESTATLYINGQNKNYWRNSLLKKWRGDEAVQVKVVNYKKFLSPGICIKMDIEGSEFAILDRLSTQAKIKKLVFEWSFDINDDVKYFLSIIDKLRGMFAVVNFPDTKKLRQADRWPKSWFPPCLTVYCEKRPPQLP